MRGEPADTRPIETPGRITAWRCGEFVLCPVQRRLLRAGAVVELDERAFDLVLLLAQNHQRPLDRREIIATLWGTRPVSDNTLRQLLHKARRALGDDGERQDVIRTLHGRSLQWVAPLVALDEPTIAPPATTVQSPMGGPARVSAARKRVPRRWLAVAATIVALLGAGALWSRNDFILQATSRDGAPLPRVAIEPIVNATGEAALDWTTNGLPGLLGSLLGEDGRVDVVSPLLTAHAWARKPQQGRDQEQQLRFSSGADVLVGGQLRKVGDKFYELRLQVRQEHALETAITVVGERPGTLAADVAGRLRRALHVESPAHTSASGQMPHDPFLAEAFARGVDMAVQGKWADARNFYAICVNGDPRFLPARMNLGTAQTQSNDLQGGEKTLKDALALAQQRGDASIAGRALFQLGHLATNRGQASAGLDDVQAAIPYLNRATDIATETQAHLVAAADAYSLNRNDLGDRELAAGKRLLARHSNLRRERGVLSDVEGIVASIHGDSAAGIAACRDGLALRESLGDERDVVVSMNNLALHLHDADRQSESLALVARAYLKARKGHYAELEFDTAENLVRDLLDAGLSTQAIALDARLMELAQSEHSKLWQVFALELRGEAQLFDGDATAALATLRQADPLLKAADARSDIYLGQQVEEAIAAFSADPGALASINGRFEAFVAAHTPDQADGDPSWRRQGLLLHALSAAAAGQATIASSFLRAAAAVTYKGSDDDSTLGSIALMVASADNDPAAASIAWQRRDPASFTHAALLARYVRWMSHVDNHVDRERAQVRLAQLQRDAKTALAGAGIDDNRLLATL